MREFSICTPDSDVLNQILYSGLLHSGFGIQKSWQMKTAQILQLTRSLTPRKLDNTAEMNIDIMSDIAVMPYPMSRGVYLLRKPNFQLSHISA